MRTLFLSLCFFSLCIAGCNNEQQQPHQTISISLSHGTELREVLGELRSQFYRIAPPLKDGRYVTIQLTSQHPVTVAKVLHAAEDRTDGWISPHPLFVNLNQTNTHGRYSDCTPLFSTSLGVIGRKQSLEKLRDQDSRISLLSLLTIQQQQNLLLLPDPLKSSTGWAALEHLASLQTIRDSHNIDTAVKTISDWQRSINYYGESERALLDQIERRNSPSALALLTKQQFQKFNRNRLIDFAELNPIGTQFLYELCTADDLTATEREAFKHFMTFLNTELAERIITKHAYDSSRGNNSPHIFSETTKTGDITSLFFNLLLRWHEIKKPPFRVVVLDTSASLEGSPFASVKESLKLAFANTPEKSIQSLVAFNTTPVLTLSLSNDRLKFLASLDNTTVSGGSAVYDGLLKGIAELQKISDTDARKYIYLITDGDDKNSHANLLDVLAQLSQDAHLRTYRLAIIALRTSSETSFEDLRQIAQAADGLFVETTPRHVGSILQELLSSAE